MKLINKSLIVGILFLFAGPINAATVIVEMRNNFFTPDEVTINVGDTIIWVQRGSNHDTVSYDGMWDSGLLRLNQTFSFTFTSAGSFRYYCTPHEQVGMIGTVNVEGGGGNTPPTVALTAPASGATFQTTDTITFTATATDDGSVAKVEFFAGANLIGTDTSSPYTITASLAAGTHSITARATDNAGATTTSTTVSIAVQEPAANQPPSIALTSPIAATLSAPASILLHAEASDSDGTVVQVEFFNGSASLGVDSTAPFEIPLTALAAGVFSFTAVATDNSGARTTSAAVAVKIAVQPQITSIARNNDQITINVQGTEGIPLVLETSLDLIAWAGTATNTPAAGPTIFTDSPNTPKMFYRVIAR
jgi:plastocyanin